VPEPDTTAPSRGAPRRARFYRVLAVVAVLVASLLLSASWATTAFQIHVDPFPPTPPVASGPSGAHVTITGVFARFQGYGYSPTLEPLNITQNLSGLAPYEFPAGEYLVWEGLPVNPQNTSDALYATLTLSPGFVWNGPSYSGGVFPPNGPLPVSLPFTLPYVNYTGPLVFEFQA
jgi:hypothetical protein